MRAAPPCACNWRRVGHVDVNAISFTLPDGRPLLGDVTFRVGEGATVALIGPNGTGKTTLLRIVARRPRAARGRRDAQRRPGGHAAVRRARSATTPRCATCSSRVAPRAGARGRPPRSTPPSCAMMERDDEPAQMAYAQALADWADAGGYEHETLWDVCTVAALGMPFERAQWREVRTLSGGEQKRLVLEALLRGPDEVLLLDEPDNYLDVPGKRWLEERAAESPKTVLFVSHDRELLDRVASGSRRSSRGRRAPPLWVHPGRFATYHQARAERNERLEELRRRWDEEHAKLKALVLMYRRRRRTTTGWPRATRPPQTRLRKFEEAGPPRGAAVASRTCGCGCRRPYRQAGRGLRAARAHRADAAVRPRGLVRRAGGGARQERLGQVALPAAAGRRRQRPRRRAPAGRRRRPGAGGPPRRRPARARGCGPAGSPRPTSTPS